MENNETESGINIFSFINPLQNDKLSNLKGSDLQELIILLNSYYLELRRNINVDQKLTFGLELEFEYTDRNRVTNSLNELEIQDGWIIKSDASLEHGAEINSPILIDKEKSWQELDDVCKMVSKYSSIGRKAASHIHIGSHILGKEKESWMNFFKIWSAYENILFRFLYGEHLNDRDSIKYYAAPVSKDLWELSQAKYQSMNALFMEATEIDKYKAVNFCNVDHAIEGIEERNTIEFRCPNGTLNSVIWQNNVNALLKLLLYSKSQKFNESIVEERHRIYGEDEIDIRHYNEIFLTAALELCDIIFDNNLDKLYFLRQYLKSYKVGKRTQDYTKQLVSFTKKL